jgi:hypothetical protein
MLIFTDDAAIKYVEERIDARAAFDSQAMADTFNGHLNDSSGIT